MAVNITLAEIVDYFAARGLVWPNTEDALLFLVSEVGELAGAFMAAETTSTETKHVLGWVQAVGLEADLTVKNRRGWVRNNNRAHDDDAKTADELKRDLEYEIGDVRMMLDVFADDVAGESSETLMRKKFRHQMRKTQK